MIDELKEALGSRDFEAILGQVADGISVQDPTGALVYANDAAAHLVGFASGQELMAAPIAEVMSRFELYDEEGLPLPLERLPGRLALRGFESERVLRYREVGTGRDRWSIVRATPILGDDGEVRYAVNAFQDITARKRVEEGLRVLAEASRTLASLNYHAILMEVPRLVVPRLADACSLWLAEGSSLRRVAGASADAEEQVPAEYSLEDRGLPLVEAFHAAEPVLLPETPARHAGVVLPLVARGRPFGLLDLVSFTPGRLDEADLELGAELAGRIAVAIDRAVLYRESQEARSDIEFLGEAGEALNQTLDYETTLEILSRLVVPRLAEWSGFYLNEEGTGRRLFGAHMDDAKRALVEETARRFPFDLDDPAHPISLALFEGRSSLFEHVSDEELRAAASSDEHFAAMKDLGFTTAMVVPLATRGRVIGAMTLVRSAAGPAYRAQDLRVAEELGRRAAAAIENARNYGRAQERAVAAQALEFVGDGVCLIDRDGRVRLWNPAAEAITGLAAADIVGSPAGEAIGGWSRVAANVHPGARPEALPVDVGDRELWISISAVEFSGGTVFAFRDVTDERALDRLKNEFISTISHELRTPLAAIYGAAMTMRRSEPDIRARHDELLDVVAAEAERLTRTVNDVLWASRLETGGVEIRIESCDASELLEGVVASARMHLPEILEIEIEHANGLPRVAADPDKVRQVLANLLDNAVKYSPDGGTIRVRVEDAGRYLRFVVCDEGLGVPVGERERIFEKFYRLDPNLTRGVGGTGLGLYICRELVQRMDGRVHVESNAPRGSVFMVELPAAS